MSAALYDVVPASARHIKPLSARLRPAACATLRLLGLDPRVALRRAFQSSFYVRTVLLEGRPEAMWGLQGAALSDHAVVWTALSETAARFPLAVVRRARHELAEMSARSGALYATVGREDSRAMLFAKSVGFVTCEDGDSHMALMMFGAG